MKNRTKPLHDATTWTAAERRHVSEACAFYDEHYMKPQRALILKTSRSDTARAAIAATYKQWQKAWKKVNQTKVTDE